MTVVIDLLTGAGPTSTAVSSVVMNREDSIAGPTAIPTPTSTGTKFAWIKSFQPEITATGGLTMTNIKIGKVTSEAVTGIKLWHYTGHAVGAYVQAVAAPSDTGDNNATAPTLNGGTATAVPLMSAPPAAYAAGPFNTTGRKGNLVEVTLGVDATCVTAGSAVAVPSLQWQWTEA